MISSKNALGITTWDSLYTNAPGIDVVVGNEVEGAKAVEGAKVVEGAKAVEPVLRQTRSCRVQFFPDLDLGTCINDTGLQTYRARCEMIRDLVG